MKNKPTKTKIRFSELFDLGKDVDEETELKIAEALFEKLEERIIGEPKSYQRYREREKNIQNVLLKNSVCKIFCLIANGTNYNDAIAKEYYKGKEQKFYNPKVTAIFLKELRDAGIIKRADREGRKQIYEVDWQGLFDIILYKDSMVHPAQEAFRMSHFFYHPWIRDDENGKNKKIEFMAPLGIELTENQIEKIKEKICLNLFKPYVEEYIRLKLISQYIDIEKPFPYRELVYSIDNKGNQIQNIELIDINILDILKDFDKEFIDSFPDTFEQEIRKIITLAEKKKIPDYINFILQSYSHYYKGDIFSKKREYLETEIPNPKNKLLRSFSNEFKKNGINFDIGGK